uniref:Cathepsin L-like proteinase n=1 Tax=Diabrotica virgifera virgifera TaxID=50390 RepID=A0A6P7GSQ2_DIAVI
MNIDSSYSSEKATSLNQSIYQEELWVQRTRVAPLLQFSSLSGAITWAKSDETLVKTQNKRFPQIPNDSRYKGAEEVYQTDTNTLQDKRHPQLPNDSRYKGAEEVYQTDTNTLQDKRHPQLPNDSRYKGAEEVYQTDTNTLQNKDSSRCRRTEIYKKKYDITNEKYRFNIFINNLKRIEQHNNRYQNGEVGYYIGVNQFADLTSEEFISRVTSPISDTFPATINNVVQVTDDVPDEIDWREKGAVLGVKNQLEGCKASWAFTATGVIEGQLAIQKKQNISLSEQHLIDCSTEYHYNRGCSDGNSDYALLFTHDHGICSEGDYPYTAKEGSCQNCSLVLESVAYPTRVLVNEISLKEIVGM